MRRLLKRGLGGLLGLIVLVAIGLAVWEPVFADAATPPPARGYDGRIVRDEFGVPHLFGKTDADVSYALAYAHAEDDFFTLQETIAMTRGRLGAMTGSDGAKVDYVGHLLDARGTARARYGELPADVRALLDAYASGMNLYAARHPGEVRLAKLFPINGEDIATGFALRSPFFFGLDEVLGALAGDSPLPTQNSAAMLSGPPPLAQGASRPSPEAEGSMNGSNAFAVAPKRSADGRTRLFSNSHQPWNGGVAWYELGVHSGQGWDFYGATFPGVPFPVMGHNRDLGWTNTVNRPDLTDVYRLRMEGDDRYRFDGKLRPLEARRVWLPVKFGPFVLPIPRLVHRSVHGPVIVNKTGAYAIRYAGMGTIGQIAQYYRITKARDWDEWSAAMAMHQIPATNFIYADKAGRIAHVYNAMFPARKAGFDYRWIVPGDTSKALDMRTVPWRAVPQNIDPASGFLQNANNSPFLASGPGAELSAAAFAALLGIEGNVTNRGNRATALMAADASISEADLLRIKFDTTYERSGYAGRWFAAIAKLDVRGDAQMIAAQRLLAGWDWTLDGKGRADALALLLLRPANRWNYRSQPMPDPREDFEKQVAHLVKHFGRIDPPLGDVLRLRRGKVDLPLDGGPDVLRAAPLWDLDEDGRARVRHGDSFMLLTDWDANGRVRSRSIQPFGAATTRPESPHYADQALLFATHRFKPVHFERDDLLRHAKRAYRP